MNNIETIINNVVEFGNYLLTINDNPDKLCIITGNLINSPNAYKLFFVKHITPQNDDDDDDTDPEHIKYSQLYSLINTFGLIDNEVNRDKLLEYINYFVSVKDFINID
jgi:hypothetical protein